MTHTLRDNTFDKAIWFNVVQNNGYLLPATFCESDVILDVGSHTGSFSYAVLKRGAGLVWSFEADVTNFMLASTNLSSFGRKVQLFHQAVGRSDVLVPRVWLTGYPRSDEHLNTGGASVVTESGAVSVQGRSFDDIVDELTNFGSRRVRLLKLDCEGSEYPTVLTSERLHLIDEVVIEYHLWPRSTSLERIPDFAGVEGAMTMDGVNRMAQKFDPRWVLGETSRELKGFRKAVRMEPGTASVVVQENV